MTESFEILAERAKKSPFTSYAIKHRSIAMWLCGVGAHRSEWDSQSRQQITDLVLQLSKHEWARIMENISKSDSPEWRWINSLATVRTFHEL